MDPYEKYIASNPSKCIVCGSAFASERSAITKEFTGEYYSFCSSSCLGTFEADPEKFVRFEEEEENGH
ncbi:YHS domain-containing protein [Candidatus Uhrbacteria bacterium]|nr:YHS domain-containing protein [Candidatus Uhrbacteria bacterium]